jgi:hypothetical protein
MCCKKNSLCCCTEQLAISFQLFSTNHQHPLAQWNESMLEAWSIGILQVCHVAAVVALVDVMELAECWPWFVA